MDQSQDHLKRRCPLLGNPVAFRYCRQCGGHQQPCGRIIYCWWEYFDIVHYLKSNLPEYDCNALLNYRPKPKINTLVELVEKAKNRGL